MSNVLTFKPRPKPAAPETPEPLVGDELRAQVEAGVQAALDLADHFIAVLNGMDGCPDLEDGANDEPSLAAPENHHASQVTWLRGNDQDREAEAPEIVLPEVATETPSTVIEVEALRWGGRGNVLAAAGAYLFDLLERA